MIRSSWQSALIPALATMFITLGGLQAQILFDFDQPYFVEELDVQCKDHALLKEDGVYHIFYIHSLPPPDEDSYRNERWLGHLVSDDLRHWTRQDSILPVSEVPDSWEESYIWAPKVTKKGKAKTQVFDFTGLQLGGRLRTPQLLYFLDRAEQELDRAALEKRSFIPEMTRSMEEERL